MRPLACMHRCKEKSSPAGMQRQRGPLAVLVAPPRNAAKCSSAPCTKGLMKKWPGAQLEVWYNADLLLKPSGGLWLQNEEVAWTVQVLTLLGILLA